MVSITFDRLLEDGALATGNWTLVLYGAERTVTGASASGAGVTLTTGLTGTVMEGDQVAYAASPADVRALVGSVPAAPFTGLEITAGG